MSRNEFDTLQKMSEVQMKMLAALLGQASSCCPPKPSCNPCPNGADALYDLARLQLSFYDRMLGLMTGGGCGCARTSCCERPKCQCGCSSKVPANPKVPADCCGPSDALTPATPTCLQFVAAAGGTARAKFVLRNDNATTVEIKLEVTDFVLRGSAPPTICDGAKVRFLDANGDEVSNPLCLAAFQCVELWIEIELAGDCWADCEYWDAKLTAKGCGMCHELCLTLYVTDGCAPEFEPEPAPAKCADDAYIDAIALKVLEKLNAQLSHSKGE